MSRNCPVLTYGTVSCIHVTAVVCAVRGLRPIASPTLFPRGAAERGHGKVERGHRRGSAKAERGHRWSTRKRSAVPHF